MKKIVTTQGRIQDAMKHRIYRNKKKYHRPSEKEMATLLKLLMKNTGDE
tara:strand:+ start:406 stop:552 length:147 start_codon:yes stop_codon:yes gene_type:complete